MCDLLFERSQTLKSYTEWKYRADNDDRFRGVIAKIKDKPVGCFGSVPKELKLSDGSIKQCGWFADWYVTPEARGLRVGELLLNSLSEYEPIMFGHPGPKTAQKICLNNDYKKIGFQSRRRLILRRWSYNWKRGVLFQGILINVKRKLFRNTTFGTIQKEEESHHENIPDNQRENIYRSEFLQSELYENWVHNQPINKNFKRKSGLWESDGCVIKYFDEQITNNEKRRSVLFMDSGDLTNRHMWNSFIEDTRRAKQDYIEIFITDKKIDSIFQELGAWKIHEAPIMVRGLDVDSMDIQIQPWDREGWTNLSSNNKQ